MPENFPARALPQTNSFQLSTKTAQQFLKTNLGKSRNTFSFILFACWFGVFTMFSSRNLKFGSMRLGTALYQQL